MYSTPNVENENVEFEVLTLMSVKNVVFLEVMACVLVNICRRLRGTVICPLDRYSRFFQNLCK